MIRNFFVSIVLLSAPLLGIYDLKANAAENTIVKEITPYVNKAEKTPATFQFIDENTYAMLSEQKTSIDRYDVTSGKKLETIFSVDNTRQTTIQAIEGFEISADMRKILVWNSTEGIYRRSFKARYFVYDCHSRVLEPLSNEFAITQCAMFSPDSRMIAFVHDNNIYLKKLDYNTQVAVTTDGKVGEIINGATDWTYEEEFQTTALMAFSPDNAVLCYVKTNESDVPSYSLPIYQNNCGGNADARYKPLIQEYKYPTPGENNSTVTVHTYELSNRKTKDITFEDKTIEYIPRIDFVPSGQLFVTTLNRDQNRMEIYSVHPQTTLSTSVFVEKSDAWILPDTYEKLHIVKDGFVVMSARTGWTHLYKYAFNGSLTRTLTQGEYDVTDFYGQDVAGNVYFQGASPSPIDRTVYRTDIKGVKTSMTQEGGYASATFSADCRYAVLNYSNYTTPPVYTLVNGSGKHIRQLEDNEDVKHLIRNQATKEFITVPGNNGLQFNAYVIKPADFNPSKRYPVVMYQYSGPGSQSVLNRWDLSWEYYFASKGIVVFCLDGRGTGGRGTEFMYSVYKNLGHFETLDQLTGARWLANQSWVDSSKIGIHGWSYGGYETLMCLQADNSPFTAGVAIAPVTDWRLYDSVYTERYMLTPQQNLENYLTSAPVYSTTKMRSDLLLMTGTSDDNVHPINTYNYAAALEYDGALFDMMVFPGKNHSIYGCNARAVVYGNMYRFFSHSFGLK